MRDERYGLDYVYVIAARDGDRFASPIKVGMTRKLRARLSTIATSCPFPIGLVHSIVVPERWIARIIEDRFHRAHRPFRMAGEWFDMSPVDGVRGLTDTLIGVLDEGGIDPYGQSRILQKAGAGSEAEHVIALLEMKNGTRQ